MDKYFGILKNRKQALKWASILEQGGAIEKDAGKMLRKNWEYIAARPELARQTYEMVRHISQIEPLDVNRPGSIMNRLISPLNIVKFKK